jgi:hypothetical protein
MLEPIELNPAELMPAGGFLMPAAISHSSAISAGVDAGRLFARLRATTAFVWCQPIGSMPIALARSVNKYANSKESCDQGAS